LNPSSNNVQARYQDITIATPAKNLHISPRKNSTFPEIKFLGLRDRYFCTIIEPGAGKHQGVIRKINPQEFEAGLGSPDLTIALGEQIGQNYLVYLGPQRLGLLNSAKTEWTNVIHYGTFDFISQILLQMLEFIHRLVRNWGLAIIALSILVYLILFPLTLKQIRSTKEMQALQPQVEALRKAYKDNPQRLNKEIMELYRQHKVNPLGGCLPLILQMPIFFALYQALMRSIALKGAKFLWIKDLSEPDKLFSLKLMGTKLDINILPILMIIGMLIQQRISAVATSASSAEQQKTMMIVMPVMFGIIFYGMPSGLVLYWFINSLLMLLFQLRTNRAK
jgi:YidC/Oxa1 family membrane protein insertase